MWLLFAHVFAGALASSVDVLGTKHGGTFDVYAECEHRPSYRSDAHVLKYRAGAWRLGTSQNCTVSDDFAHAVDTSLTPLGTTWVEDGQPSPIRVVKRHLRHFDVPSDDDLLYERPDRDCLFWFRSTCVF